MPPQGVPGQMSSPESLRLAGKVAQPPHNDPESHLKGRYHWNKRTAEGLKKGIEYFREAIAVDPNCAPCYAGLVGRQL